jgi:hypothetical protein
VLRCDKDGVLYFGFQVQTLHIKVGSLHCLVKNIKNVQEENRNYAVLRIRIRMYLSHPDPLVRGTGLDPDLSIIQLKSKKNLDSYCSVTFQ